MNTTVLGGPVTAFLGKYLYYLLLAILFLNVLQRRHMKTGEKKRLATLYLSVATLVLMGIALGINHFRLPDLLLIPALAAIGILAWVYRERVLPFRLSCRKCGTRLDFKRLAFHDSNLCATCDPAANADPPPAK